MVVKVLNDKYIEVRIKEVLKNYYGIIVNVEVLLEDYGINIRFVRK